jgi:hypothetical protein
MPGYALTSISEFPTPTPSASVYRGCRNRESLRWRLFPHLRPAGLDVALDAYEAADREIAIREKRWVLEHVRFGLFWVMLTNSWRDWRTVLIIVKPGTVVRWHRQ